MSLENVNEGETAYLTVAFSDKSGNPEAPTTISYRIDCLKNDEEILTDTSVTPAAAEVEITLLPSENIIIDQLNFLEKRLVTVTGTYGDDDAIIREYEYNVKNMRKKT